jgi:hypothetical protein
MPRRVTMRPRFEIPLKRADGECFKRLADLLAVENAPYSGQVLREHAYIQLPRTERSFLSPYLNLRIIEKEDRSFLQGRFTPHPHVWTGFMAVYGILGLIALAGLMYGLAQMTVQEAPWGLWAVPFCLSLIAFVYGAAIIGQGLTNDEMYRMRAYIECLVRQKEFDRDRNYLPEAETSDSPQETGA